MKKIMKVISKLSDINRCAIIIQARMTSQRFPRKMMSYFSGIPLIAYIYQRCKGSSIRNILVATSEDVSDNELYNYCKINNILVIRGSLNNVLERYILAANSIGAKYIVRVCGDTPFVDLSLSESILKVLIDERLDYVAFDKETCASGFYSEAVTLQALKDTAMLTSAKEDLEHVTKFIIENKNKFLTKFIEINLNPMFLRKVRLTIDYPEDIQQAIEIVDQLANKFSFTSQEIIDIVNKGYLKIIAQ